MSERSVLGLATLQQVVRSGAPKSDVGLIYFIAPVGEHDPIKVGFTKDLARRLIAYIGHSPLPLTLLALAEGPREVESALHGLFKLDRLHGEWFKSSPEMLSIVEMYRYVPGQPPLEIDLTPKIAMDELRISICRHIARETTGHSQRPLAADRTIIPWMSR